MLLAVRTQAVRAARQEGSGQIRSVPARENQKPPGWLPVRRDPTGLDPVNATQQVSIVSRILVEEVIQVHAGSLETKQVVSEIQTGENRDVVGFRMRSPMRIAAIDN